MIVVVPDVYWEKCLGVSIPEGPYKGLNIGWVYYFSWLLGQDSLLATLIKVLHFWHAKSNSFGKFEQRIYIHIGIY